MKQYSRNSLLLSFVLLLQGCAWNYGIEPIYPSSSKYNIFAEEVGSLMPTFRWKPYIANIQISNITYDFQVLDGPSWSLPNVIYERKNILVSHHKIYIKLEENKKYSWRVRTNYTEKGNKLVTRWNGYGFMVLPAPGGGSISHHYFITPDL